MTMIMPPINPPAPIWRTDAAPDQTAPADLAKRLTYMRRTYGDAETLDAITAASGDVQAAYRSLRAQRQSQARAAKRADRRARRADQVIYEGPIEIGPRLRAVIDGGREVKCEMGDGRRIRSTFVGALTGLPTDDYDSDGGNHVVLYDPRIGDGWAPGAITGEVLWTGADYRIHLWRKSPMDLRTPITLEITDAA